MTARAIVAAVLAGAILAACSGPASGRVTERRYAPAKTEVVMETCESGGPDGCALRPVAVARPEQWTLTVVDVVDVRDVEVTQGEWTHCPPGAVYPECAGGGR